MADVKPKGFVVDLEAAAKRTPAEAAAVDRQFAREIREKLDALTPKALLQGVDALNGFRTGAAAPMPDPAWPLVSLEVKRRIERQVLAAQQARIEEMAQSHQAFQAAIDSGARSAEARVDREIQSLNALRAIQTSLDSLAARVAAHDLNLQQHAEQIEDIRSGGPGRPTSMHLVELEFNERVKRGEWQELLSEESRALSRWLRRAHPKAPRLTPKAIENDLRERFRDARRAAGLPIRASRKRK